MAKKSADHSERDTRSDTHPTTKLWLYISLCVLRVCEPAAVGATLRLTPQLAPDDFSLRSGSAPAQAPPLRFRSVRNRPPLAAPFASGPQFIVKDSNY